MVKVIDQDIPAWFYREYQRSLGFAHESKTGSGIFSVRKRPPYKLPHMRTNSGNSPSGAQLKVREAFKKCVDCFNNSPRKGGAIPPEIGYRSKEWWYHESNSETWPDYVGKEKQKWNPEEEDAQQWKKSDGNYEPSNWFLQTDEPDFITFYDEMKSKYGFPWSPTNNPDQICIKMNKIVINEIEYNLDQDTTITWTPGETAKARKGVCDDQSVLHYALTYKALTDLGWSAEQINERLAMIPNWCGGGGHVFNWWKQNNGATKIVENTLDPNQAPDVVGDLWYWGHWKSKHLIQRVNKDGAYNPRIIGNGVIYPLWYYNLFIHRSWQTFFDGGVPEWCYDSSLNIPYDLKELAWVNGGTSVASNRVRGLIYASKGTKQIYRSFFRLDITSLWDEELAFFRIKYTPGGTNAVMQKWLHSSSYSNEIFNGLDVKTCDIYDPNTITWDNQPTQLELIKKIEYLESAPTYRYYTEYMNLTNELLQQAVNKKDTYFYISITYRDDWAQINDLNFYNQSAIRSHGFWANKFSYFTVTAQAGIK